MLASSICVGVPAVVVKSCAVVEYRPPYASKPVPTGPVGPVAPVAPVGPVAPSSPAIPWSPCGPVGPVAPVAPVGVCNLVQLERSCIFMYNYCTNLKKRTKRKQQILFCKKLNKEITFGCCKNCEYKQYKQAKEYKMKTKSSKLAKKERNRYSVLCDSDKCAVCESERSLTWHEIYSGAYRQSSMKYGMCLRLCMKCHSEYQENTDFSNFWKKEGQEYWEQNIGTTEEFIGVFGRSYK